MKTLLRDLKNVLVRWECENRSFEKQLSDYFSLNPQMGARDRRQFKDWAYLILRYWTVIKDKNYSWEIPKDLRQLEENLSQLLKQKKPEEYLARLHKKGKPKFVDSPREHLLAYHNFSLNSSSIAKLEDWHEYFHSSLQRAPFSVRETSKGKQQNVATVLQDLGFRRSFFLGDAWIREEECFDLTFREALSNGLLVIQDENSQLISELCFEMLREQCGSDKLKILDLCAGAGGKALHLADLAQKKTADIFAYDVRKKALKELHRRKKLVEVSNIFFLEDNDLSKAAKSKGFDLILIDAPCSGWGTLRRSPEFANAPVDTGLNTLQSELILRAKSLANENTMIAYVTCSVREEENEGLVRKFVKESSLPSIKALNNQIWKSFFGGNWEDFCQDLESSRAHQVREPSNLGTQWGLSKKLSGDGFYLVFVPAKAIL